MKHKYCIVVIALIAAAAFMTGACSRMKTIETDKGKVTFSEEGGTVNIETKEGKAVASFGDAVKLPTDLSKDIPVYKPAKVTMSQVFGDGEKVMLGLNTTDDSTKVMAFYNKELTDKGWQVRNLMNLGPTKMLQGQKGEQKVHVTISSNGKETTITLAYSGK